MSRGWYLTVCAGLATGALADVVSLTPQKDNTLYFDPLGQLSNGAGEYLFTGATATGEPRRAVLKFDLSGIPPGSTVTAVSLTVTLSRTISGDATVALHRLLSDWGEGASNAGAPGGIGAPAMPGDATWIHTFHDTQFWSTPGGDYALTPSATTVIGNVLGPYTWLSTASLVADVQAWLNNPASNAGWIVIGDEGTPGSAKRLNSREHLDPASRPVLVVTYVPPAPPCYPNCDGSTTVPFLNVADFTCFLQRFAAGDPYANCDGSTTPPVLNVADFTCFLQRFAAGCSAP